MPEQEQLRQKVADILNKAKTGELQTVRGIYVRNPSNGGIVLGNSRMKYFLDVIKHAINKTPLIGKAVKWFYWLAKAPRLTKQHSKAIEELTKDNQEQIGLMRSEIDELRARIQRYKVMNAAHAGFLAELSGKFINTPVFKATEEEKNKLNETFDEISDELYLDFENRFRGSRKDIKERQKEYLPYVLSLSAQADKVKAVDLGSGRGEWLELLKENGIKVSGVDLNKRMVRRCRYLGFEVIESDAVKYLKSCRDEDLDLLTAFHLVEHIGMRSLIELFREAIRVLKPGGMLIFETPNPESLLVISPNFYLDMTHQTPIPPLTLEFLAQNNGFEKIEIKRITPVNFVESRLDDPLKPILDKFNMPQEYALIAYKSL